MAAPDGASNGILGWILGGIGIGGALWAVGAKLFSFVTRAELARVLEKQDTKFKEAMAAQIEDRRRIVAEQHDDMETRHQENRGNFQRLADRLGLVERGQAKIEGSIERIRPMDREG